MVGADERATSYCVKSNIDLTESEALKLLTFEDKKYEKELKSNFTKCIEISKAEAVHFFDIVWLRQVLVLKDKLFKSI